LFSTGAANAEGIYEKMEKGLEAYENRNYDKALEHFIEAQLDEPEMPEIAYNLGAAYYRRGEYKAAARNFAHALHSESPGLRARSFYNLGNANFRQGNYGKAIENYQAALKITPGDQEAAANLAFAKKLLEKQQHKQQSAPDQDGEKQDQKQDRQEQSSEEQQRQQQQAESESESQSAKNRNEPNGSQDSAKRQQQEKNASEPGENESAGPEKNSGEEQDKQASVRPEKGEEKGAGKSQGRENLEKRIQAETMLNRLKDKPGKALMPAYGRNRVEKDW
jgi:Ca-activated chloride channel family protein